MTEQAGLLEPDALRLAFERGGEDLDALLRDVQLAQIRPAAALRLPAPGGRFVVVRRRRVRAAPRLRSGANCRRFSVVVELLGELVELGLRLGELELELVRVDALGLREEDATAEQLEVPLELLVRMLKLVPFGAHRRELGSHRPEIDSRLRERLRRRRERGRHLLERALELCDPSQRLFEISTA